MTESNIVSRRPFEAALAEMKVQAELNRDSGFDVAAQVADRIMSATTFEEIDEAVSSGPAGLDTIEGEVFRFVGGSLHWRYSAEQFREGGTGFYAVFTVLDRKGTEHVISTGAVNVVFQLRKYQEMGVFDNPGEPYPREFTVKSRPTANGTLYRVVSA